ncbi:MAG: hypothetical protein EBV03_09700, partial [Proteobacteria bacterium]|nr:hypothetical protein [Pseudomonadota bacterium]
IGLGFRTGAVIAQAARSLDNPYKPLFLDAEKKVARVIATSVQPRAVTNAMKREMAFLVTDAASIMPFNDALAMPTPGYWGKHELFQALNSNVFTDMIAVSSPGLEPKRMAWLLRHETEHSVDLSHRMSFAELYKDSLKEALADDRAEFDALYHMVEKITPKSHPVEIRKMQKLAKLLKLEDAENPRLSADALMKMKDRVEHMLAAVNGRFGSFAPHTPGNTHVSYQLKTCMLAEVPAVIEELNGVLGQPFVKEVLPRLYEASRMHRSLHPHFREDAKARREQAAIPTSRA